MDQSGKARQNPLVGPLTSVLLLPARKSVPTFFPAAGGCLKSQSTPGEWETKLQLVPVFGSGHVSFVQLVEFGFREEQLVMVLCVDVKGPGVRVDHAVITGSLWGPRKPSKTWCSFGKTHGLCIW